MRAVSAVTEGSASSLCWTHRAFSFSASGFQSEAVILSDSIQYACTPRPELTIVGLGSFVAFKKPLSASNPSLWSAYGFPKPQSISIKKDFNLFALAAVLPALGSIKEDSAK